MNSFHDNSYRSSMQSFGGQTPKFDLDRRISNSTNGSLRRSRVVSFGGLMSSFFSLKGSLLKEEESENEQEINKAPLIHQKKRSET